MGQPAEDLSGRRGAAITLTALPLCLLLLYAAGRLRHESGPFAVPALLPLLVLLAPLRSALRAVGAGAVATPDALVLPRPLGRGVRLPWAEVRAVRPAPGGFWLVDTGGGRVHRVFTQAPAAFARAMLRSAPWAELAPSLRDWGASAPFRLNRRSAALVATALLAPFAVVAAAVLMTRF